MEQNKGTYNNKEKWLSLPKRNKIPYGAALFVNLVPPFAEEVVFFCHKQDVKPNDPLFFFFYQEPVKSTTPVTELSGWEGSREMCIEEDIALREWVVSTALKT